MTTLTTKLSAALLSLAAFGVTTSTPARASVDVEPGAPAFEISELDDGSTLLEWVSPTPWDEIVADDVDALSVPLGQAAFANALILGPGANLEAVIDEVEEVEEEMAPPVLLPDFRGLFGPSPRGEIELLPPAEESSEPVEPEAPAEPQTHEHEEEPSRDAPEIDDQPRDTPPPASQGEEIGRRKKYPLSYKFFAGHADPKVAERRIRGARKYYVPAFQWWAKQIKKSCSYDVVFTDLGDDTKTMTHEVVKKNEKRKPEAETVGYDGFASLAKWARAPKHTWIVGKKQRDALLRSPRPRQQFHLAIFKTNKIRWLRSGKESPAEHVVPKSGIGILRKPLLNRDKTAVHETGHFLGLRHHHGAVMSYASKSKQKGGSQYGKKKFKKSWCDVIESSIRSAV